MAVGFECSRPFVISHRETSVSSCCGCSANILSDTLKVGVRIDRGKSCTVNWYHYKCFWTHCVYCKYLRGSNKDTMHELVEGLNTINSSERQTFYKEASTPIFRKYSQNKKSVSSSCSTEKPKQSCSSSGSTEKQKQSCSRSGSTEKRKSETKEKVKSHKGSVQDGDYEVDPITFDLTDMVCVCVHKYHTSDVIISIRQYFKPTGATVVKPTQKGISLTSDQWSKLVDMKTDIDGAIAEVSSSSAVKDKKKSKKKKKNEELIEEDDDEADHIIFSLAWKRRVSVYDEGEEVIVDIRDYSEEKTFSPSTKGIQMTIEQWGNLNSYKDELNNLISKLMSK